MDKLLDSYIEEITSQKTEMSQKEVLHKLIVFETLSLCDWIDRDKLRALDILYGMHRVRKMEFCLFPVCCVTKDSINYWEGDQKIAAKLPRDIIDQFPKSGRWSVLIARDLHKNTFEFPLYDRNKLYVVCGKINKRSFVVVDSPFNLQKKLRYVGNDIYCDDKKIN